MIQSLSINTYNIGIKRSIVGTVNVNESIRHGRTKYAANAKNIIPIG